MWRDEFFEHEGDKDWWHKHDWMEFPIEKKLWEMADEYEDGFIVSDPK